jgi:hypothetical protein
LEMRERTVRRAGEVPTTSSNMETWSISSPEVEPLDG